MQAAADRPSPSPVAVVVPLLILGTVAGILVFLAGRDSGSTELVGSGREIEGHAQSEQPQARALNEPKLLVDGTNLLDVAGKGDSLVPFADKQVQGENLEIQEVVNQNLLWVGRNSERRVLVSIATNSAQVRPRDANDGDRVALEVGVLIELVGTVRTLQANLDGVEVTDPDDAAELQAQGAYVYAETVLVDS